MSSVRVKVCGVTRLEDAALAVKLGADALGFNFWPGSKRYIAPSVAAEISRRLPPFVTKVGVFVNQSERDIVRIARAVGLYAIQLHGDEDPAFCSRFEWPVIKAARIGSLADVRELKAYPVSAILVDAPSPQFGGSGKTFDWKLIGGLPKKQIVILAGGLNAENVATAIRRVRPFAVDVASGVERTPGIKDARKMARFIRAAKEAVR